MPAPLRPLSGIVARPILAAAGVAAPIATLGVLLGSRAAIVVAVAAWAALAWFVLAAPRLWPGTAARRARTAVAVAWGVAMIAFVVGFVGHYVVAVAHELCGGGPGTSTAALAAAAVVYLAGSVWALRSGGRAVWAWPILMLAGWGMHLALLFALGAHGFCET
jgi:hypothetical protein